MTTGRSFIYPMRDADIWGLNEDQSQRDPEDVASDLEFNQRALEDYVTNDLPNIYITQSGFGSGVMDPGQIATGQATTGRAPVIGATTSIAAWTDVFTQTEATQSIAGTYGSQDIQRGIISSGSLNVGNTNSSVTGTYTNAYAAAPRVTIGVECQAGTALFHTLTAVTTSGLTVKVTALAAVTATTTFLVHWHAVKA